jgi:hypothetical protein
LIPAIASLQVPSGEVFGEISFCFNIDQGFFSILPLLERNVQDAEVFRNPCFMWQCFFFILDFEWPVASPVGCSQDASRDRNIVRYERLC